MKTKLTGVASFLGVALFVSLFCFDADAAGKARVGVLPLRGAGEGPVRAKLSNALKTNGFQVVGSEQLESTAKGLSVSLDGDAGFKAVAKELNIAAFVGGELTKHEADLTVRNGADAAVIGEASFAGANPKKIAAAVGANFWRQLGGAVKKGRPPAGGKSKAAIAEEAAPADSGAEGAAEEAAPSPPPEPRRKSARRTTATTEPRKAEGDGEAATDSGTKKSTEAAEPQAAGEESSGAAWGGAGLPALVIGVGGGALFRKLAWHQDIQNQLAPYSLSPGPEAALSLEAYPAAFMNHSFAANVGVFGGFNYGFGVKSNTSGPTGGATLTTSFHDYLGGVKVRLPLGMLTPSVSVAYAAQSFSLSTVNGVQVVPSVNYKMIRLGAGMRVAVGPAGSVDFNAAYLLVTDPGSKVGEIRSAAFFPRATAYGVDLNLSVGYRLIKRVGVRAGIDFRQYGLSFDVRSGEQPVAGGATDRYITAGAGIEVFFDGVGGGADDEKEPEEAGAARGAGTGPAGDADADAPAPRAKARKAPGAEPEPEAN